MKLFGKKSSTNPLPELQKNVQTGLHLPNCSSMDHRLLALAIIQGPQFHGGILGSRKGPKFGGTPT